MCAKILSGMSSMRIFIINMSSISMSSKLNEGNTCQNKIIGLISLPPSPGLATALAPTVVLKLVRKTISVHSFKVQEQRF